MPSDRDLVMRFATSSVKHFGLQMYSTAVPALAEIVSNAWDADARNVWLDMPFDQPIDDGMAITCRDDGTGMTIDDCIDKYLVVGRNRRRSNRTDRTDGGRPVMGHKGLGKFAPLGVAATVRVRTVRDGELTDFAMDYESLVPEDEDGSDEGDVTKEYKPRVFARADPVDEPNGTTITMSRLRLQRRIDATEFRTSMARRFTAIAPGEFTVHINDVGLAPFSMDFEHRFPPDGTQEEIVNGFGSVRWWLGFTEKPIPNKELAGLSVVARGKLVQAPFLFQMSKGVTAQHGLQYLAGVVEADGLDDADDLVATDRASVLWEHPKAQPLLEWGQDRIRASLVEWAKRRANTRLDTMRAERPRLHAILESLDSYVPKERKEIRSIVDRFAVFIDDDEELVEAVDTVKAAYEDRRFVQMVRDFSEKDDASLVDIIEFVRSYEVIEWLKVGQVAAARATVIKQLRQHIADRTREKPELQDFVRDHPWLLDPAWSILRHERAIDTLLRDVIGSGERDQETGQRRVDFFCLADSYRVVVVELKRPGHTATLEEFQRYQAYVTTLSDHYSAKTNRADKRLVEGLFIATDMVLGARAQVRMAENVGARVTDWDSVLQRAMNLHREYADALKTGMVPRDGRYHTIATMLAFD